MDESSCLEATLTPRFPRIRELIESWHLPADVIPVKRTWGDWWRDLLRGGMKRTAMGVLHFAEWLLRD